MMNTRVDLWTIPPADVLWWCVEIEAQGDAGSFPAPECDPGDGGDMKEGNIGALVCPPEHKTGLEDQPMVKVGMIRVDLLWKLRSFNTLNKKLGIFNQ